MMRGLYRCLIWIHPPVFRREFAAEMLWIYDETAETDGAVRLFLDGLVSVARQWLVRSGCWKIIAALVGGLLPIAFGSALMLSIGEYGGIAYSVRRLSAVENPELAALIHLVALTAMGLVAAVMFLVFWWRRLARRAGD